MSNLSQVSRTPITLQATLGMPPGGPKCLPIQLDFSAANSYELDYTNMQQRNFLDMCQTLWVDNSLSSSELWVSIPGSQQTIKVPAASQGYFTVLCPNPIKMNFTQPVNDPVVCQVTLMNYPVIG